MSKYINKIITKEIDIEIRGTKYKEITYDDGEIILKKFNNRTKMWIVCRFSQEDDKHNISEIREMAKQIAFNTI